MSARAPTPESTATSNPVAANSANPLLRSDRSRLVRAATLFLGGLLAFSILPSAVNAAAGPSANLDQCQNGALGPPVVHTSPCDWVNGDLNPAHSHFREGESVPFRMVVSGLTPGSTVHSITIGYDITHSSKHAYDYLTSFQRIAETVDPCAGISPCGARSNFSIPLPAGVPQPQGSFNALSAGERVMDIYGGTITGITYPSQGLLSDAQSETTMKITFTAAAAKVVLAWGGHIASGDDWPGAAAAQISGSPYHMRLKDLDTKGGNQDRSLKASAVLPIHPLGASLTVVKEVTNDDGGSALPSDFSLHVLFAGNSSDVAGSPQPGDSIGTSYVSLPAGDYVVGEDALDGYLLTSITGDCASDGTISLLDGDLKTCILANDDQLAHLLVVKHVVNDDGGLQVASDWLMNVSAGADSAAFPGDENGTDVPLSVGQAYSVSESGPDGYDPDFSADCSGSLASGETKTCTVTNDDIRPKLTVIKHVINDDGGDQVASDWNMTVAGAEADPGSFPGDENGTEVSLGAGAQYAVSEDGPAGYNATLSGDCSGSLLPGDSKTCTVTNDDIRPDLLVVKHVVNDDGGSALAANFTMSVDGAEADPSSFPGDENGTGVSLKANAQYNVSEDGPGGYDPGFSADCSGSLLPGDSKTCTVTNDDIRPRLTVIKHVVNDDGGLLEADDWDLSVDGAEASPADFAGSEGGVLVSLAAGAQYNVSEDGPAGYSASFSADCSGVLAPGDNKTCTITNDDIRPRLTVIKHVVNDDGGLLDASAWTMGVNGTNADPSSFAGDENGTLVLLDANAAYAVGEDGPGGYNATYSGDCSGILAPGDNKTCTVTNDDIRPRLTVTKVVVNDDGGQAVVADFPLFVDDHGVASGVEEGFLPGDHAVSETGSSGYAATISGDCDEDGNVTLALGDVKSCTITNDDIRPILTVIKHVVNDALGTSEASDFLVSVSGEAASPDQFLGAESPGVLVSLNASAYSVTEGAHSGYAVSYSADCSGTLLPGDNKTCTITNDDLALTTRTQGFWDTHTAFTQRVLALMGGSMTVGGGSHTRVIGDPAKLFGAYESSVSKTTTGAKRTAVDQARMILLQQLVTAKLNCAAFGCSDDVQALIVAADLAYAGSSAADMLAASTLLDAYNNSGDAGAIPTSLGSPGAATPKVSGALANKVFWNSP
jgi:hypothetical protein